MITHNLINDDVILIQGDLIFEGKVFERILNSEYPNFVHINCLRPLPEKDFKGRIEKGIVRKICVNIFGADCHSLLPLYKMSKNSFLILINEIERFVEEGKLSLFTEDVLIRFRTVGLVMTPSLNFWKIDDLNIIWRPKKLQL